jgi:hypothetical protein
MQNRNFINISDFTFEFFKILELFCREKLTHERLVDMDQFLFRVVKFVSRSFCFLFTSDKVSGFFVEAINSSYDEHKEIKMFNVKLKGIMMIFLKFWMT